MRIAIVSDIHGNRTAFEAVLADLQQTSPDLIFHGGDLADSGSSAVEIVDQIRDLGWQGVLGNTDEMLARPESLEEFAAKSPHLQQLFVVIREMAAATREALGEERLDWLSCLPKAQKSGPIALVHGSPESPWQSPVPESSDVELETVYGTLHHPIAVYGHVHRPFVRRASGMMVANGGSVGLPYDGDCRASYLLLDEFDIVIRRVQYDVEREEKALSSCGLPHGDWVARMLKSGSFQMP